MAVKRFMARFLLIVTVIQLGYAKNPFHIQQDTIHLTYDRQHFQSMRVYIENNNIYILLNLTKPIPTNAIIGLKLLHRNPRGKYDMVGIPWSSNLCKFIQSDRIVYDDLRKLENTELPEKCPIQAGRYYVKNYDVNQVTIPIPIPLGQYRLEFRGLSGKAEIVKIVWNGKLIPA